MSSAHPEVLIVGAGPTGLSAALLLGRLGIATHVITSHPGTTTHPRAHIVNARTMELFRQWGIADQVRAAAIPVEEGMGVRWMTRMSGLELGRIMADDYPDLLASMLDQSSEVLRSCPQDILEPILLRAAREQECVSVEFGAKAVGISCGSRGVTTRVQAVEGAARAPRTIHSSYVIGADGAHSTLRELLGVRAPVLKPVGDMMGVYFAADLSEYRRDRPCLLWWIVNPDTQGALVALDTGQRWAYLFGYNPQYQESDSFTAEGCAHIVRQAVGLSGLPVQIKGIAPWKLEIAIADRFCVGRVFLAGDAAHRFPPTGGFGMNTGIQDAHNLAWKLALVLRGKAGESVLCSYEDERRPVAKLNAEQSMLNAERMAETGALLDHSLSLQSVEEESEEGLRVRSEIAASILRQRRHFLFNGQTFGYVYDSMATIDDGPAAPASSVEVYRPCAHPGALAPHLWLRSSAGRTVALVDLTGDRFAVLHAAGDDAWKVASCHVGENLGIKIEVISIGADGEWADDRGNWLEAYEIDDSGCVLIRPDGHVGMRWPTVPPDPAEALQDALMRILGLCGSGTALTE